MLIPCGAVAVTGVKQQMCFYHLKMGLQVLDNSHGHRYDNTQERTNTLEGGSKFDSLKPTYNIIMCTYRRGKPV